MKRPTPETAKLAATASADGHGPIPETGGDLARGTSVGRYRAYDPDLDRSVALKLVRADQRNADRRQRLRARLIREAQTLARLSHPNVVAVHDVGLHRDDVFVAMELIDGPTLRRLVERDKPSVARIVELFIAAARGLHAAHAVSIVHRDFKPDNVLVSHDGEAHVSDFGIARAVHEDDDLAGAVVGTPAYMAPEQVAGHDVDHRADQYSFCVSLYEALYGQLPVKPPQIPARTAAGAWVPARVRAAIARGLSVDPAARFASMDVLTCKLQKQPVVRALPIVGAVGIATAIIGIVIATRPAGIECESAAGQLAGVWDAPRRASVHAALESHGASSAAVEKMLDHYTSQWVQMHETSCRATHVRGEQSPELLDLRTECLQRRLSEVKHLTDALSSADTEVASRAIASVHALSPIEDCANTTALRDPVPPRDRERARALRDRFAKARVAFSIGKFADVERDTATLVTESEAAGDRWLEASATYLGARAMRALGKAKLAERALYRSVELAESGRASDVAAEAWMTIAWILGQDLGKPADAIKLVGVARGVIERTGGNPRLEATLEDYLGVLHLDANELVPARQHLDRARALREQLYGTTDAEYAAVLQHLAILESASGNRDKALEVHHRARVITEAELGPGHRETLAILGGEGATLYELGRYQEANDLLEAGLATVDKTLGPESEIATSFLLNLGLARWKLGRLAEARTALERSLAIMEAHAPDAPRVADLHSNLALVLEDMHEPAAAKQHALRADELAHAQR